MLGLQVRVHQPSTKKTLAADTDVDVGMQIAVGTWVACHSFDHALTRHLIAAGLVLAANKTASSITSVLE